MTGREGARGPLAVNAQLAAVMALELGHVVGDVVDLVGIPCRIGPEHLGDRLTGAVGDRGAVGPGEVGSSGHRGQVILALRRAHRRTRKLAVGQLDSEPGERLVHALDEVRTHLVPEATGAGVDQERDLVQPQTVGVGGLRLIDAVHALELEKVVARPQRAQLAGAALAGPGGDGARPGSVQAPLRFGEVQLLLAADPQFLIQRPWPLLEYPLELGAH